MTRLAAELRNSRELPEALRSSGATAAQLRQLVAVLLQHWVDTPPQRGKARHHTHEELRVVLGFGLARRMIAFSDFARAGRSLEYDGNDIDALFHEIRFGGSGKEEAPAPAAPARPQVINPIEVLEKLELSGDRQMMEHWVQTDVSDTGIGATAPAVRATHRIGSLVCLRYADGIEWHLGLIRRIGRDAPGQATFGIETRPWPSTSAQVKPLAAEASAAWTKLEDAGHGYLDAILVSHGGDELVLPRGSFTADLAIRVRTGEAVRQVKLVASLEQGDDFDRVRFAPLD